MADRYLTDATFRVFADRVMAWLSRLKPGHSLNLSKMDEPRRTDTYMAAVAFFTVWPTAHRDYFFTDDFNSLCRRREAPEPTRSDCREDWRNDYIRRQFNNNK